MPLSRSARTVKLAVHSINCGIMNSPTGTAKNKKPKGNIRRRAMRQPSTAGTRLTSRAMKASCVTAWMEARSPSTQANSAAATSGQALSAGWGVRASTAWRRRHTKYSAMGGTKKAWAKVSERDQMATIAKPVSRYR